MSTNAEITTMCNIYVWFAIEKLGYHWNHENRAAGFREKQSYSLFQNSWITSRIKYFVYFCNLHFMLNKCASHFMCTLRTLTCINDWFVDSTDILSLSRSPRLLFKIKCRCIGLNRTKEQSNKVHKETLNFQLNFMNEKKTILRMKRKEFLTYQYAVLTSCFE